MSARKAASGKGTGQGGAGRRGADVRSDLHVTFESRSSGAIELELHSKVETMYGESLRAGFEQMLYWVFAAWPGDARSECDRDSRYARQGCRDYGYLIAFDDAKGPVMAYPGFVLVKALDLMGHEHVVPRWVVERFR